MESLFCIRNKTTGEYFVGSAAGYGFSRFTKRKRKYYTKHSTAQAQATCLVKYAQLDANDLEIVEFELRPKVVYEVRRNNEEVPVMV
jgi:4-diphosphocytidyl-2C-methyl-D-erythritol kinase